jgi:hypothetical protein
MAQARSTAARTLLALPPWLAATTEYNESFRFDSLTMLEAAKTRLAEIEAKPPADASSVAVAVLHPVHLTVKALLAAKGVKARSTRATVDLLRVLYDGAITPELIAGYVGVQRVEIQGARAVDAAKALIAAAATLLTR